MQNITKKLQKMRQEKVKTKHESETLRNLNKIQIPEVPDKKKKKKIRKLTALTDEEKEEVEQMISQAIEMQAEIKE